MVSVGLILFDYDSHLPEPTNAQLAEKLGLNELRLRLKRGR
jgi:hypothetical protein